MITEFEELFGKTDEVKILALIIPSGYKSSFTEEQLSKATGIPLRRVQKIIRLYQEMGLVFGGGKKIIRNNSSVARAIHSLIHAAFEDKLEKEQREALKGDEQGDD